MKTKALRRKMRQIEDIVEDVEGWMNDHREELSEQAGYEIGSLGGKLTDLRALAVAAGTTLDTIETLTKGEEKTETLW